MSDDLIKRLRDTAVIRAADIHEAADRIVALEAENNRRAGIIHDQDAHILALEAQVARLREADPSAPIDLSQEAVDDMAWTLDHMGEPGSRPRHAAAMLRALRAAAPADPVAEAARVYIASKALHGPKWVQLRDAGLPIISTWIDESGVGETINWPGLWSRCISEASDCTHLIAYRELGEILKGAWAEVGAALAHGRKVILCGDFTEFSIKHHPNVTIWASSDIRTALRAITEASHAAD